MKQSSVNNPLLVKKAYDKVKDDPKKVASFWKRGILSYKLRPWQVEIYNAVRAGQLSNADEPSVVLCARRIGKTFTNSLIALENCLRNDRWLFDLVGPDQKQMRQAIYPALAEILVDCPDEMRPKINMVDGFYEFRHNGSKLNIFGVNGGHADSGRGGTAHGMLIDEAGQIDELEYVLYDVFLPRMNTTGGHCVLASTPAVTTDHPFYAIWERAHSTNNCVSLHHGNLPQLPEEMKKQAIKSSRGVNTTTYKREYLCEWVVDQDRRIINEWEETKENVCNPPKTEFYKFYDKYVAMDLGYKRDLTAVLWAYYDFTEAKLVIEDEWTCKGPRTITSELARVIKKKEEDLWGSQKPFRRISDNNESRTIADLAHDHNITFMETSKDQIKAMVNQVRLWVENDRLIVSPKCKHLRACLSSGIWNKTQREFDRSAVYGHYDALAALVYLIRNVSEHHNPIPKGYGINPYKHVFKDEEVETEAQRLAKVLIPGLKRFGR